MTLRHVACEFKEGILPRDHLFSTGQQPVIVIPMPPGGEGIQTIPAKPVPHSCKGEVMQKLRAISQAVGVSTLLLLSVIFYHIDAYAGSVKAINNYSKAVEVSTYAGAAKALVNTKQLAQNTTSIVTEDKTNSIWISKIDVKIPITNTLIKSYNVSLPSSMTCFVVTIATSGSVNVAMESCPVILDHGGSSPPVGNQPPPHIP